MRNWKRVPRQCCNFKCFELAGIDGRNRDSFTTHQCFQSRNKLFVSQCMSLVLPVRLTQSSTVKSAEWPPFRTDGSAPSRGRVNFAAGRGSVSLHPAFRRVLPPSPLMRNLAQSRMPLALLVTSVHQVPYLLTLKELSLPRRVCVCVCVVVVFLVVVVVLFVVVWEDILCCCFCFCFKALDDFSWGKCHIIKNNAVKARQQQNKEKIKATETLNDVLSVAHISKVSKRVNAAAPFPSKISQSISKISQ